MTEQNASVDFDFFEIPCCESTSEDDTLSAHNKLPARKDSDKGAVKSEPRRRSPSPSGSSRSASPCYSSDSSFSDTESESKQESKRKTRLSRSSSGSSFSSKSRSKSRSDSNGPYSRSRSSSQSERGRGKKSRTSSKNDGRKGSKFRPNEEEDDYSSSAYSDGENGRSVDEAASLKRNGKKQAWGDSHRSGGKTSDKRQSTRGSRPMTAKARPGQKKQSSRNKSSSESDSEALSDSDITDVSPMESPRTHERSKFGQAHVGLAQVGASGDGNPVKIQYRAMPVSHQDLNGDDGEDADNAPRSGLDLEILMKAVGELEKQKRVEANTRRVMFAPMTLKRSEKSNYTFDKDKTRDIERENQRLLNEIVHRVNAGDQRKQYRHTQPPLTRMTPSAVNREKEMRRIEADNLSILKRLQKVKPTQSISRTNQIRSYENTKLHGIPISALHPVPKMGRRTTSRAEDSVSSIGSRTRSLTSLHSVSSSVRSAGSRRSSRPSSATKRIDPRPEWSDRW